MKKILITGITGMVGSHLLDYLFHNTEYKIYGGCRWRSPVDNISQYLDKNDAKIKERVELVDFDLTDVFSIQNTLIKSSPDIIFHLAAQSYPTTSFSAPIDTLNTNIIGTANLLESIRLLKLSPIVHICSSSEVFGRVDKKYIPINEGVPFHPASPYAISKIGTDYLGKFYADAYGINTVITRMFTHTGPRRGEVFAESTFAKQIALIEAGLQEPIVRTGNLDSMRTWSDVRDAVRAYFLLVNSDFVPGEAFNIGGNFSCSVGEMLEHLLSISRVKGIKVQTEQSRLRPIDADLQVPDCSKFISQVNWVPEYSFDRTMSDLLNYWRTKVIAK